ncbi:hypothetical protein D3C75_1169870 [compost metagenome]
MQADLVAQQRPAADPKVIQTGEYRHRDIGRIRCQTEHLRLHRKTNRHDGHAPDHTQQRQSRFITGGGQQQ